MAAGCILNRTRQSKMEIRYNTFTHAQFTGVDTAARFDTASQQVNSR